MKVRCKNLGVCLNNILGRFNSFCVFSQSRKRLNLTWGHSPITSIRASTINYQFYHGKNPIRVNHHAWKKILRRIKNFHLDSGHPGFRWERTTLGSELFGEDLLCGLGSVDWWVVGLDLVSMSWLLQVVLARAMVWEQKKENEECSCQLGPRSTVITVDFLFLFCDFL